MDSSTDEQFRTAESKILSSFAAYSTSSTEVATPTNSPTLIDDEFENEDCECDLGLGRRKIDFDDGDSQKPEHTSGEYLLHNALHSADLTKYGSFAKPMRLMTSKRPTLCTESAETSRDSFDESKQHELQVNSSAIGGSLHEQKIICRKDVENVFIHKILEEIQNDDSSFGSKVLQYIGDESQKKQTSLLLIKKKFLDAVTEVERLKNDLSARCRQLDSKHDAIQILQTQLDQAYRAHQLEYDACKSLDTNCKKLEKELDEVRWEWEVRDYQVGQSQDSWRDRLEIVERENRQLHSALQRTQAELKSVQRENTVMSQEKQELLLLMQLSQDERHASSLAESDTYHDLSAPEMSVLGSCSCGDQGSRSNCETGATVTLVHPCRCAWSLVNSRREIKHLKSRVKDLSEKHVNSLKIGDLYRRAFEDQLEKNRRIFAAIVHHQFKADHNAGKRSVTKLNFCFFGGNLLLESCTNPKEDPKSDQPGGDQNYMLNIIDMLRDRTEELFHKRLSAQFLADKIYQLEAELKVMKDLQRQSGHPDNNTSVTPKPPTGASDCQQTCPESTEHSPPQQKKEETANMTDSSDFGSIFVADLN